MAQSYHLCWINHEGGELVYSIRDTATVGRAADNEITVDEEGVSRRHCRLEIGAEGLQLQDLGSTNGTFVNGRRVERVDLGDGDEILVGRSLLRVHKDPGDTGKAGGVSSGGGETLELVLDATRSEYPSPADSAGRTGEHLHTLCRVMDAINARGSAEEMYRQALQAVCSSLEMEFGAVLLGLDPTAEPLVETGMAPGGTPPLSRTVLARVLGDGQAILTNDVASDERLAASRSLAGAGVTRVLCCPIARAGQVSGALYLTTGRRQRPATESDLRLLTLVGAQLGLAAEKRRRQELVRAENRVLRHNLVGTPNIVGSSAALCRVRELTRRAAGTDVTVLIRGETGTGKELFARALHEWSKRKGRPFIAVNCGAIAENIVESELFGHEQGAFTGASERRLGRFEMAGNGTLFLDEIGELPGSIQVKLLRVLEERHFYRVGGSAKLRSNARIVAATNRDLVELVRQGEFRQDLFYRIHVFEIVVPPLRKRVADIGEIADHLLVKLAREMGRNKPCLAKDARERMAAYPWPGNVRELRNVLERALILARSDRIEAQDLFPEASVRAGSVPDGASNPCRTLKDVEREHIQAVLDATGWNKSEAAAILGIGRTNIYAKIRQYGLERERDR